VSRTLRKAARIVGVESLQWDVFQFYVAGGFKESRSGILVNPWSQAYQLDQDS